MNNSVVLKAVGLQKSYKEGGRLLHVLKDVNLEVHEGESVAIVGTSGSGKTTLLQCIGGLDRFDKGLIEIGGENIAELSEQRLTELRNRKLGFVYQFHHLLPEFTAMENVAMPLKIRREKASVAQKRAESLLKAMGLADRVDHLPSQLSGGERNRVHLAKMLRKGANVILLDEPTNDLDIVTLNVLEEYLRNFKGCAIVVSHDRYFMDKVVDHLLVFRGNADIKDFPGNYTQYRDWKDVQDQLEKEAEAALQARQNPAPEKPSRPVNEQKKKLTFKERKEFEALEEEIPALEAEKAELETAMSSGTLSTDELMAKSQRITQVMEEIDEKTMRWLELSELA